ncbi:MAG TPA: squalene synthase HpnC [Acidimicrobiales bacterium]|nr:squalene synthase HpnC [Acidimicrobiales bacterium]
MTTRSLSYTTLQAGRPADLPTPERILGRAAGENFAVASRVLPSRARRHLLAFYGYARFTDELGDSYTGDRLAALDWLEEETRTALAGDHGSAHPLVGPAARSVVELGLDSRPLFDLIEANRQDQAVHSYLTFEDLVGYCRLSANPVGRLVLGAFGYQDERRCALSDAVCTGLQLVEHWQDVREDALAGRVYLPGEDLDRFGVDAAVLGQEPPAPQELKALMAFEVYRARLWLDRGAPLVGALHGRARVAVAGFVAGGRVALDGIARRDFDVLSPPSRPRATAIARQMLMTARTRHGEAA